VPPKITIEPLTPDRWEDFERLFGPQGASGGCWCMHFRTRSSEQRRATGSQNKAAMRRIVDSGEPPGLLAYVDGEPAGWVSLDPREKFPHLVHSRKYRALDDQPVWNVVCFVIGENFRRQGLSEKLLEAAVQYARKNGARIVEAYPIEPHDELIGYAGFTGIRSVFDRCGFTEAGRAGNGRPIMRRMLR
jgi:GNAT superfamily N-acetyltransferase